MFNNLIESNSHSREFKRRGSFFLYTVAAYVLLFTAAGVASIYAYDAQLDEQTEQIITMLRPVDFPSTPQRVVTERPRGTEPSRGAPVIAERQAAVARTDMPQLQPTGVSTHPNPGLPIPIGEGYIVTGRDRDGAGSPLEPGSGAPSSTGTGPTAVQIAVPPPPPVVPKPAPQIVRKNIINGLAIELPKPPYPHLAKNIHVQGMVSVQVLIDESGKVVSAHVLSGHALLTGEAVRAAYRARFSPTKIGDQPVKVSGTITYNFVLSN